MKENEVEESYAREGEGKGREALMADGAESASWSRRRGAALKSGESAVRKAGLGVNGGRSVVAAAQQWLDDDGGVACGRAARQQCDVAERCTHGGVLCGLAAQ